MQLVKLIYSISGTKVVVHSYEELAEGFSNLSLIFVSTRRDLVKLNVNK